MTFEPKPLSKEAVPAALEKAERYRLLNEAAEAQSICRDVLRIDETNQQALVILLLAITDQFGKGSPMPIGSAKEILARLDGEYERAYYGGIICERRAKALLHRGGPGTDVIVYNSLREAMERFEKAEELRPTGNDDAILRWNTCARTLRDRNLEPVQEERFDPLLE